MCLAHPFPALTLSKGTELVVLGSLALLSTSLTQPCPKPSETGLEELWWSHPRQNWFLSSSPLPQTSGAGTPPPTPSLSPPLGLSSGALSLVLTAPPLRPRPLGRPRPAGRFREVCHSLETPVCCLVLSRLGCCTAVRFSPRARRVWLGGRCVLPASPPRSLRPA